MTIDDTLEWVSRGGSADSFTFTTEDAIAVYTHATQVAAGLGVPLSLTTVRLMPGKNLADAIDFALTRAETAGA